MTDSQGRSEPCGFAFPRTTLFIFPYLEMRPGDGFPRRGIDEKKKRALIYNEKQNNTLRFSTEFKNDRVADVNIVRIAMFYIP